MLKLPTHYLWVRKVIFIVRAGQTEMRFLVFKGVVKVLTVASNTDHVEPHPTAVPPGRPW